MGFNRKLFLLGVLLSVFLFAFVLSDPHAHANAGEHDHDHDHGDHGNHQHDHAHTEQKSNVIDLDFSSFADFIKNNDYVFVEFYAPWCGHCRNLAPIWEELASALVAEESNVKIAKVDAAQDTLLAQEYDIQGFPTLKLFKKGIPFDYEGGRDINSLRNWVVRKTSPPVQKIESAAKVSAFQHGLIAYFPDVSSPLRKRFLDAAELLEFDGWNFAEVNTAELAAALNLKANEPSLVEAGKEPVSFQLNDNTDTDTVRKFICQNGYAGVEEISQSVYQRLEKCGRPFAIYFYTDKADSDSFIANVASKFSGKIGLSIADGTRWKDVLVRMGGSGKVVPSIIAFSKSKKGADSVLAWDEEVELTHASAEAWFNQILDGTAKGFLKSEPIPDNTGRSVHVLVGKSFESIVYDTTKDVLVEYYAPWCPHCKNIEPMYNQLGALISAATDKVVIAKIDATANSVPDDLGVAGFPTIHFFPAGDKTNPINYDGDRTLHDLAAFVSAQATNKFELDLSNIPEPEAEGEWEEDVEEDEDDDDDDDDEIEEVEEVEEDEEEEAEEDDLKDEL